MTNVDLYNLDRFVDAQRSVYEEVLAELLAERKESHWIWFIFPQIAGLGHSSTAQFYSIRSLDQAQAYARHSLLGSRLRECTELVNRIEGKSIREIFGAPDDLKFRSSMTLFAQASQDNGLFQAALDKYFNGEPDPLTLERLPRRS
jgi:uncharacterized protein (DUF1810 family)